MSKPDDKGQQMADVQHRLALERTHLANERTFAAWLRTGLSVAAAGIAVSHFLPRTDHTLGAIFVIAGVSLIIFGAWRFTRTQQELSAAGAPDRRMARLTISVVSGIMSALLLALLLAG
ncbi:MAG: YidH family protein [Gemmatimonadaceae bacterium]